MRPISNQGRLPQLAIALIAVLGAAVILVATPWGIGMEYDSVFYWAAAENLLEGRGLGRLDGTGEFIPLTHFPPLYPIAMAAVAGLSGMPVAAAARLTSAVLFALNVFLLGQLTLSLTGDARLALGAAASGLIAPTILVRHLWAMSEPLYFTMLLTSLGFLSRSLRDSGHRWFIASAVMAGLAALTRYSGLSLVATGVFAYLLLDDFTIGVRIRRAALFGLGSAILPILWQLRNMLMAGTPTNRVLIFHLPEMGKLREAGSTLASWVPYEGIPAEVRLAAVIALGLGIVCIAAIQPRSWGTPGNSRPWLMTMAAALHGLIYLVFLGVSLSLFDASTRLNDRILSPLFLVGILMLTGSLTLAPAKTPRGIRYAGVAAIALIAVPYLAVSAARLSESWQLGLGFSGQSWRESETLAQVRELQSELRIYSNEALPIYYLTGRPASAVPERLDPVKGVLRFGYRQDLESMHDEIRAGEAALVLFHPTQLRAELPPIDELTAGMEPVLRTTDGMIYLTQKTGSGKQ